MTAAVETMPETERQVHPQRLIFLDGLRAIAIVFVLCNHLVSRVVTGDNLPARALLEFSRWAGSGVDLFFAISGFLITGILLDARGSHNFFRRFYWRRSLRIFPAFYAFLLVMAILSPGLFAQTPFAVFALYLRNLTGADGLSDGILGHLWSLAVEEQFYIAWSVVVFLCPAKHMAKLTLGLIVAAPLVRAAMYHFDYPVYLIYRVTPARMDSLLYGALFAVGARSMTRASLAKIGRWGIAASSAGLALLVMRAGWFDGTLLAYQVVSLSLVPLLYASILAVCLDLAPQNPAIRILSSRPFSITAKYSYSIYLWHLFAAAAAGIPFIQWAATHSAFFAEHLMILLVPVVFAVSLIIAVISWELIEQPCLRLKDHYFN